jgi:hypothetical protein
MKQVSSKKKFFYSKSVNGNLTTETIMVYNDKLGFQPDFQGIMYEGEVESVHAMKS